MMWSKGTVILGVLSLSLAMPSLASTGRWLTEVGAGIESGSGSGFGMRQLSVTGPLVHGRDGNEQWQTAWQFEYTQFDWQGTTAAAGDYVWVSLPIAYQQQRSARHQLRIVIEPGLMSDLSQLDTDHFMVNVQALSRHTLRHVREYWQWGVIVDRRFGDAEIRPSVAYAWPVSRHTQASVGFPFSSLQTQWSESLHTFVRVQPVGGVWQETVTLAAAGDAGEEEGGDAEVGDAASPGGELSSRLRYRSWQASLGARAAWRDGWWVSAEVGQLRNRRIVATSTDGSRTRATPSNHGYWLLGLELHY